MLFFARSEAIHWRKKRIEKTALPVHPTIFQGVTTIKANTAEWINESIRGYRIDSPASPSPRCGSKKRSKAKNNAFEWRANQRLKIGIGIMVSVRTSQMGR